MLLQQSIQQNHAELVHTGRIAQRRGLSVEKHAKLGISFCASPHFITYSRAICCRWVILFRGLDVQMVRLGVVNRHTELSIAIAVGQVKLRICIWRLAWRGTRRRQLFDDFYAL